jgi:hypothetical protein
MSYDTTSEMTDGMLKPDEMNREWQITVTVPSDTAWTIAKGYLNMVIAKCLGIGEAKDAYLKDTVLPLKRRYLAGERTSELHEEITKCTWE